MHGRFFDFNRIKSSKKQTLTKLKNQYINGYKSLTPKPINITSIKGRRLIMAEGEALRRMTKGYCKEQDRYKLEDVMKSNGCYWGGDDQYGFFSGHEKLSYKINNTKDGQQTINITSQHKPAAGHAGNFKMFYIGNYGKDQIKDDDDQYIDGGVLDAIYAVTRKNKKTSSKIVEEQKLARLFLSCLKKGGPITTLIIEQAGLSFYKDKNPDERKKILKLLNRVLVLTGIKEITRRMHGSEIELPFAIAHIQALKLVADGHLTMKDIFNKHAPYGLPTGEHLTNIYDGKSKAFEKLRALNALYTEKFPNEGAKSKDFHKLLLENYDDSSSSDTDGEGYSSSEDEKIQPTPL